MAQSTSRIHFGPYQLDVPAAQLWIGQEAVALQPRPLAVLSYLAARPGTVVGRDELIRALWGGTHVTKAVLKVAVRAVREALDDDAEAPRYIETVGREGYRFIGAGDAPLPTANDQARQGASIVGRDEELARLRACLARAAGGERSVVFLTGEAGIGKTTLLDRFIAAVQREGNVAIARGVCLEQYGEGEAYLPVLEALGRLSRDESMPELAQTLARYAPTWLAHLAALEPMPPAAWHREQAVGTAPARMLREMADALEVFTRERTLLLVLDDLHWSDPSTVDLIECIARRQQQARLLIVGTSRPPEGANAAHPVHDMRQDLQAKGLCQDIRLSLLTPDEIYFYLEARFAGVPAEALRRLAARVYQRTEGNALFLVNVVNDLVAGGALAWRDGRWHVEDSIDVATERIPSGLQELIGRALVSLEPSARRVLEAASVVGDEVIVSAVAAALESEPDAVEDECEQIAAQGSLLAEKGVAELPDGSVSGRYRFRHAMYRRVLYDGIAAARRIRLHRAVGLRLEEGYGPRASEHAAELAMHFERGLDHRRALQFHELALASALDRHAPHEAVAHCTAALEALANTPRGRDRAKRELGLVVARATLFMAIRGYAAPETEQAFARARALCESQPPGPQLYATLRGLLSYHHVRAELGEARALGEQLLALSAKQPKDAILRVQVHYGHGATLFHLGELDEARRHLEAALAEYRPETHHKQILLFGGYDPGVACSLWLAWTLALQGEIEQAASYTRAGLALAKSLGDAFSLAWAYYGVGVSNQMFGDYRTSEAACAEAMKMSEEHGFPHVRGMATLNCGWAILRQGRAAEAIALVRDGMAMIERTGALLGHPSYAGMLAAVDILEGNRSAAIARFDEALKEIVRTGERVQEAASLLGKSRILGEREKSTAALRETENCLRRAVEVARSQGAHLLELRASIALARQCQARGRTSEARAALRAVRALFADRQATTAEVAAAQRLALELED